MPIKALTDVASSEFDETRTSDPSVASHKWDLVDNTGCRNQFIRRIAFEIEPGRLNAHGKVDWPDVNAGKSSCKICVVKVDIDATKLRELGEFPEHNRRNAPSVRCQNTPLPVGHLARQGENEDVGIDVNHGLPM